MPNPNRRAILMISAIFIAVGAILAVTFALLNPTSGNAWSPTSTGMFIIIVLMIAVGLGLVIATIMRRPKPYREALETGRAGMATVVSARATGLRYRTGSRPRMYEYELSVTVTPAGGPSYATTIIEFFPKADAPQPGDTFPVRIHVERPEVVAMVPKK